MNKKAGLIVFILSVLLTASFVSAISSDLTGVYQPKETIITKISGNILEPITLGQITFKRGHVAIPLEFDVKKIGSDYYIWAIAPEEENNYTLSIGDIATTVSGRVDKVTYEKNFSVEGNLTDYNVKPGFVIMKDNFELTVFSFLDEDNSINVQFVDSGAVTLKPGENKIKLSSAGITKAGFNVIEIGEYQLPAYVTAEVDNLDSFLPEIRFKPGLIQSSILSGQNNVYPFKIVNYGEEEIDNISLDYETSLFRISPDKNINIGAGDEILLNLTLVNTDENVDSIISAKSGNFSMDLRVIINIVENESQTGTPYLTANYSESSSYSCSALSAAKCSSGEVCNGQTINGSDGTCCIGLCSAQQSSSSNYSWVGWLLGVIVLAILGYLYYKYKKTKPEGDQLKKKVSEIEKKQKESA
jgi:hypothetical protein